MLGQVLFFQTGPGLALLLASEAPLRPLNVQIARGCPLLWAADGGQGLPRCGRVPFAGMSATERQGIEGNTYRS
jgi:hypothetical protein